jgi:hypothetical protein
VFGRKLFMRSCWMLQTTGFHICKQKTIDNCTWNLSLKFIEVRIFYYLMPVIGKNMISCFYAYVEHIEIKTKTVKHFPYLDLSQNVKIRDVPYALTNIWTMIQKEYWCLIWNINMQSASSIWSNLLSNATVNIIEIVRNYVRWG